MNSLNFSDVQTQRSTHIQPSSFVNVYSLANATEVTVTVPAGAAVVAFSSTGNFFVNFQGATATGGGKTDGTGDELNPTTRYIENTTSFSIYAPLALVISVAFYGVQ